jgi:tetratricopeptide (TPR) repeat protein
MTFDGRAAIPRLYQSEVEKSGKQFKFRKNFNHCRIEESSKKLPMRSAFLLTFLFLSFPGYRQSEAITARFNRAVEFQRQGAWKEAAAEYRALLLAAPNYAEAQANLGAVLSRLGNYEEAIAAYESALRLNPKLTPILLNLGIAHYRAGQFAKAIEALEKFLAVAPDHLQARQLLGVALVELGQDPEAIPHLERTLSVAPEEVTVLYSLGTAYMRLRRPEFGSVVQRLAALREGGALAHLLQGQAHLDALELEKALSELEAAQKDSADLPRLQSMLGLAYYKLGRSEAARASFERELSRAPNDFLALYYLALLLEKQGDLSAARQRVLMALKQVPESVEAGTLLAGILIRQGQPAEALPILEQAVARQPLSTETRYLLARTYQKLGRKQEAAREFAEVERLKAQERERENVRKPNF